jgi:hypothetical protein
MKRKKPTLTERVAKLERECKRLRATVKAADDRTVGRVFDLPPVNREARGDWLIWLTLGGLVLWAISAGVIWWLT